RSVTLDIAETTMATGRRAYCSAASRAEARIRSAEPMLVPPNFMTSRLFIACESLIRSSLAHQFENRLLHLLGRETAGVQVLGVGRLGKGRFGAGAVAMVA